ncbi:MAG: hypothetical protein JWM11_6538 [Planctomycetaceae bacterium]|nr:hypothetical protein [Planctomycetaceae bacterium]
MSQFVSAVRARWALLVFVVCFGGLTVTELAAQRPHVERIRHEFLLLDIDVAATKKFATVQNHLRVGQLAEAVDLLRTVNDGQAGKLVSAGPGRYVNWQIYANMLAAALPAEGLKIYREQFDPLFRPTFETGRETLDEQLLQKVVDQGYCCTFGDDALLLLGDLAWDAGDIWRARSYWEQLLPPLQPKEPGEPVILLAYPDSDVDRSLVLGRLALCGIQAGRLDAARRILGRLVETQPDAVGHLAGRTGPIREIVQDAIDAAQRAPAPLHSSLFATFGGHPRRFDRVQQTSEIGTLRWRAELRSFGGELRRGFIHGGAGGACYFPVVYGDILLVHDGESIYAYRLETGEPVWPAEDGSAKIFSVEDLEPGAANRGFGDRPLANIGLPRFTMTVSDGRLYVRMGSVHPLSGDRGSVLVCLDLAHRDGKLVWNTFASTIETGDADWNFEGSPLVIENHVYVGLRRSNPQPQSNVACFDAATGKLIWNRKLCVGSANPNIPDFDVNQHLLTWGDGTLYYATHMGAIAAIDPDSGATKWLVTYPRVEDPRFRHELDARLRRGPLPAMFADGTLYVAPLDSDDLLAIEAETGVVKWTRSFQSPIQSLLGVSQGLVYVSGAQLWAVSAQSGRIVWPQAGDREPEAAGFGRGLLVGDSIYWPNFEEILVVDQVSGAVRQRFPLTAGHGQSGGNLLLVDGYLVVAQPNRIAVFGDLPEMRRQSQPGPNSPRNLSPARRAWNLGRINAAEQNWNAAADQFHLTRKLAGADDEWLDLPLSRVASEREFEMRLRAVRQVLDTGERKNNVGEILQQALDAAPDRVRRGLGLALAVKWLHEFGLEDTGRFARQLLDVPDFAALRVRFAREGPTSLRGWISKILMLPLPSKQSVEALGASANVSHPISELPWPLTRHWTQSFGDRSRFLVPTGPTPATDTECIIVDQSPLLCLNARDGSIRWQLRLSHPLAWAAYFQETLLLATSHDVHAVSLANGRTVWRRSLQACPKPESTVAHASLTTIENSEFRTSSKLLVEVWAPPVLCSADGLFSEFLIVEDLLLIRQGRQRIVAWRAADGEPVWNFESEQGIAPGIISSEQQVLCGTVAPGAIVILDLETGAQTGQWKTAAVPWLNRPAVRDDRTFLAVSGIGQIASWSRPGAAWHTDEGPLAWKWTGQLTQSRQPPQVLCQGELSLLIIDGDTLIVVDSLSGVMLWKVGLGRDIVEQPGETLCFDQQRVYIPADGILRAYGLRSGKIEWERSVGTPGAVYKSRLIGDSVVVFPMRTLQGVVNTVSVCNASTGHFRQRLVFPTPAGDIQPRENNLVIAGTTLLFSCGDTLVGLGSP